MRNVSPSPTRQRTGRAVCARLCAVAATGTCLMFPEPGMPAVSGLTNRSTQGPTDNCRNEPPPQAGSVPCKSWNVAGARSPAEAPGPPCADWRSPAFKHPPGAHLSLRTSGSAPIPLETGSPAQQASGCACTPFPAPAGTLRPRSTCPWLACRLALGSRQQHQKPVALL